MIHTEWNKMDYINMDAATEIRNMHILVHYKYTLRIVTYTLMDFQVNMILPSIIIWIITEFAIAENLVPRFPSVDKFSYITS